LLRLSLAGVFGLLLVSGYVVAPVLFASAPSRQLAGMLAGSVFHVANLASLGLLAVAALLGWQQASRRFRLVLAGLALLLMLNEFGIAPEIAGLKAAGAVDRHIFARWHGLAAIIHLGATLLAASLVASSEHAREGRQYAGHH